MSARLGLRRRASGRRPRARARTRVPRGRSRGQRADESGPRSRRASGGWNVSSPGSAGASCRPAIPVSPASRRVRRPAARAVRARRRFLTGPRWRWSAPGAPAPTAARSPSTSAASSPRPECGGLRDGARRRWRGAPRCARRRADRPPRSGVRAPTASTRPSTRARRGDRRPRLPRHRVPAGHAPRSPHHFPERNRLIAGLSESVVVVEADERSGALITARLALDEGRDVMAVPGSVFSRLSAGPNGLLRAGAAPVLTAGDVLAASVSPRPRAATPRSRACSHCPAGEALTVDRLAAASGLPVAQMLEALLALELGGRVCRAGRRAATALAHTPTPESRTRAGRGCGSCSPPGRSAARSGPPDAPRDGEEEAADATRCR